MRTICLFLSISFLASCQDEPNENSAFLSLDLNMFLTVLSETGSDLLSPENPDGFDFEKIRLYYDNSGERIEVNDPNMDNPRNISLHSPQDFGLNSDTPYRLAVHSIIPNKAQDSITMYLQWNEENEDIIKFEYLKTSSDSDLLGGSSIRIIKVWINDDLLWDVELNPYEPRIFILTK